MRRALSALDLGTCMVGTREQDGEKIDDGPAPEFFGHSLIRWNLKTSAVPL
ncbi:hypothetical protein [Prescottella equi]|uniref:hypothetical protein n=1 Tax=Rhodococcus hoagii TaxID=43767 RepID=UPI001EEB8EB4|nr:hypothetical protein [Prescottella equi]